MAFGGYSAGEGEGEPVRMRDDVRLRSRVRDQVEVRLWVREGEDEG